MRFQSFHLFVPPAIIFLSGLACVNTAVRDITPDDVQKLEPGVTTKSELVAYYGEPWYEMAEDNLSGLCFVNLGMRPRVLFVQFDDRGLLVHKHFNTELAHRQCRTQRNSAGGEHGGGMGGGSARGTSCNMDIQCGVGYKCVEGVCTGGIGPKVGGRCVQGNFGRKVCTNSGKRCFNDASCL